MLFSKINILLEEGYDQQSNIYGVPLSFEHNMHEFSCAKDSAALPTYCQ